MLLLTLFLSFTGYLLPWDQLAFWAVTVGTNIASSVPCVGPTVRELLIGGRAIEQATLIRFYVLHVIVLPRRRSACCSRTTCGASARTAGWRRPTRAARARRRRARRRRSPTKTYTLLGVARGTAPAVSATSLEAPDIDGQRGARPDAPRADRGRSARSRSSASWPARIASPLEEPANALVTPNPAKAPWYFLWLQEIVTDTTIRLGSFTINGAFLGGVILPGMLIALLTVWPWLDRSPAGAHGRVVPAEPAHAEPRSSSLVDAGRHRLHRSSACSCAGRTGTSTGRGKRGPTSRRGSDMEKRTNSPFPRIDRPVLAVDRRRARRRHRRSSRGAIGSTTGGTTSTRSATWWPRSSAPSRRGRGAVGPPADLGRRPRPRRPLHDLPPGRGVEGLREGRANRYRTHPWSR